MKKLLAILCAVMLVLTCSISVFAEGETSEAPTTGSIVISNAVAGKTYAVYKIFDLKYSGSAYYYTVNENWKDYFADEGKSLISVDSSGAVTVADKEAATALAKALMTYIEAVNEDDDENNNVAATASNTTGTFTGLEFGYYLVDSALGVVCGLTTTAPNAEINDKNTQTNVDKVIVEENNTEVKENTANIGDTVNFKSTITVGQGLETLTWYDTMTTGLTYNEDIAIAGLTKGEQYTVETVEGYTIVIKFKEAYLESLNADDKIVITYSATLNEEAVIAGEGNKNTVNITYGDNNEYQGTPVTTVTKTFSFDLVKTNSNNVLLAGAGFKLYADEKCTVEIPVVADGDNTYRVAVKGETGVEMITNDEHFLTIKGLETGTYYLKETTVPEGYNPLTAHEKVEIGNANLSTKMVNNTWTNDDGGVHIINNTGNVLPETGGIGTTLFIAIGSIVVLVCGVVLVARKRMSKYVA